MSAQMKENTDPGYTPAPNTLAGAEFESTRHAAFGSANSGNRGDFEEHLAHLERIKDRIDEPWADEAYFQVEYDGYAFVERWFKENPPRLFALNSTEQAA